MHRDRGTDMHAHTQTYACTYTETVTEAQTYACAYKETKAQTYAYAYTETQAHACAQNRKCGKHFATSVLYIYNTDQYNTEVSISKNKHNNLSSKHFATSVLHSLSSRPLYYTHFHLDLCITLIIISPPRKEKKQKTLPSWTTSPSRTTCTS